MRTPHALLALPCFSLPLLVLAGCPSGITAKDDLRVDDSGPADDTADSGDDTGTLPGGDTVGPDLPACTPSTGDGDLVALSEDGFFFYKDRDKDALKVGGENVSAKEVEDVCRMVPGIVEVAVVGQKHAFLNQVAVAFVIFIGVLIYVGANKKIIEALDHRSARIKGELEEARKLREEAAKLLAEYQRKQAEAQRAAVALARSNQCLSSKHFKNDWRRQR